MQVTFDQAELERRGNLKILSRDVLPLATLGAGEDFPLIVFLTNATPTALSFDLRWTDPRGEQVCTVTVSTV